MIPDGFGEALAGAALWLAIIILILCIAIGLTLYILGTIRKRWRWHIMGLIWLIIGVVMFSAGVFWYIWSLIR